MPLGGYIGELLTHCDLVKWVHREEIVVDTGTEKQSRDHRLLLRFEGQADYHALLREIINNDWYDVHKVREYRIAEEKLLFIVSSYRSLLWAKISDIAKKKPVDYRVSSRKFSYKLKLSTKLVNIAKYICKRD